MMSLVPKMAALKCLELRRKWVAAGCIALVWLALYSPMPTRQQSHVDTAGLNAPPKTRRSPGASYATHTGFRSSTESTRALSGIVQTTGGAPLPGAHVCATESAQNCCTAEQCGVTDALGRFVLENLRVEVQVLLASAPGHLSNIQSLRTDLHGSRDANVILQLQPGGAAIAGTVIDVAGGTVAGALLSARATPMGQVLASGISAPSGHFSLSVPEGAAWLAGEADAYAPVNLEVQAPVAGLTVPLVAGATMVGHVVELGTATRVPGVAVTATNVDGLHARSITASSDAEGSFSFGGLPAGRYEIAAVATRWRSRPQWIAVGAGLISDDVLIDVFPATTLHGTVRVGGQSCGSAHLQLVGPMAFEKRAQADGAIYLEGVPPGRYRADVTCAEQAHEPTNEDVEIGAEPVVRSWDLQVSTPETTEAATAPSCCEPSGTIRASLTGEDSPLALAVRLAWSRSGRSTAGLRGRLEGQEFVFEKLRLGTYDAYLEQSPETRQEVTLERDDQVLTVRLHAPRRDSIAGHVIDDRGQPIADAWVQVIHSEAAPRDARHHPTLTDLEGAFTLSGLFPGRYLVRADTPGGRAEVGGIQAGNQSVMVRVEPHGSLVGTVEDASGAGESFALAYRRRTDAEFQMTAGTGSWSLPWIPAGAYQLAVAAESGFATTEVTLEPGGTLEVPLTVDPQTRLPEWARELPRRGDLARAETK